MQNTGKKAALRLLLYGLLLLAGSAILLTGCYPGEIDSLQEADLVVTLFDQDANFSAYRTYAMPDTIIHICDVNSEDQSNCPSELRRTYDDLILNQIKDNLAAMGFRPAMAGEDTSVFVVVAANATDMYGYSSYYWYWDYWYGYPGYGWYYPPTTVYYEFTTGTLQIYMFDPAKADPNQQRLSAVWVAAINGLIGEGGNPQTRLNTAIDQAFDQSAYLGEGK